MTSSSIKQFVGKAGGGAKKGNWDGVVKGLGRKRGGDGMRVGERAVGGRDF